MSSAAVSRSSWRRPGWSSPGSWTCDRCGTLFVRTHGCVTLDVAVVADKKADKFQNWSDVDLCAKCSALVLDVIAKAMIGLRRPR